MPGPARVLIVDDHPLFLEALQRAIASVFPDAATVEATSIEAAKTELQKRGSFDIVLLDLALPGTRGFDGLLELRTLYPKTPIVVVSALEDPRIVHDVMGYGAANGKGMGKADSVLFLCRTFLCRSAVSRLGLPGVAGGEDFIWIGKLGGCEL